MPNGSLSGLSTSDGGITWSATLTGAAATEAASNQIVLNNTGYQTAAGNTGEGQQQLRLLLGRYHCPESGHQQQ